MRNAIATLCNLLLAYAVYMLTRIVFLLENYSYFSQGLTFSHLMEMFGGGLMFDTTAILVTHIPYILFMLLIPSTCHLSLITSLLTKYYFLAVNAIALAVNLADAVYFQYTMRRTTTTVFSEFQNEGNLGSIIGAEFINHWYLVLFFAVTLWLLWKLYVHPSQSSFFTARPHSKPWSKIFQLSFVKDYVLQLLVLAVSVPLIIAGIRGGFTTAVRPITISNANQYVNRPIEAALVLNTPFTLYRSIGKNVFAVPAYFQDVKELEAVYTPIHNAQDSTLHAQSVMLKKNVVVLIVESFGREYIGALNKTLDGGNYKGYTPCVDTLISHSTTFTHSYCNGRKSIDGMPSILCSIPMFVEPFILTPSSMNDYTGLAGILSAEGYQTAFFHGAQNGSMGFEAFARKTGFQHYYGRTEYEAAHGTNDFDGTWAIWDEPFLQYYVEEMSRMQQPFMTTVFTASSHHPFVVPEKYAKQFPEEGLEIHKCIRYTDQAIGRFFQTASRQPWFKNTIFVLTSDHTNMSDHAYYQTDLGGFCSPIIIYDPTQPEGEMVDKVAQQIDILPTILGLLNYHKPYFAFGIDVLNTPAEDCWAVNYMNGTYQYVQNGYILQFDGNKTKGFYALSDSLMQHNLIENSQFNAMESRLKAIVQQYMERMTQNRLVP